MKLRFIPTLLLLTIVSIVLHYLLFSQMSLDWNVWIWFLYLYFPLLSLIIYYLLNKQIAGRPQTFVTLFMGSMAAKLFISMMVLLMVIYFNPSIKIPFAISFMFLYLLYTTLNTIFIFGKLKGK